MCAVNSTSVHFAASKSPKESDELNVNILQDLRTDSLCYWNTFIATYSLFNVDMCESDKKKHAIFCFLVKPGK